MKPMELAAKLREVHKVRRDQTPLDVVVELCHEAADALVKLNSDKAWMRAELLAAGLRADPPEAT